MKTIVRSDDGQVPDRLGVDENGNVAAGYQVIVDNSCDDWPYRDAADYLLDRPSLYCSKGDAVYLLSSGEVSVEWGDETNILRCTVLRN